LANITVFLTIVVVNFSSLPQGGNEMKYKLLGRSGMRVSEICLGAMGFGEDWGWGGSKEESRNVFEAFVEKGGNFIDTANMYTAGTSEKFLGEFIEKERERYVVATKYTICTDKSDPNAGGNHRKNLVQALEKSLKRLNTEYIDLYWLHAWDFCSPVEEVMRGLDDLVRAGKILYVGISDTPAWIVSQANMLADLRGWSPFVALQIEYSLIERTPERDLIPMAKALDLAITPWGPLAGGVLSGKYNEKDSAKIDTKRSPNAERLSERALTIAREVVKVANEMGCKPTQVALNWLRSKDGLIIFRSWGPAMPTRLRKTWPVWILNSPRSI
jgi:aryl-alcohol dehydrogenase-like predicted oxidoreductase